MAVRIVRAESNEDLQAAAALRYQVSVEELGKNLSNVDHESRTVTDDLDPVSAVFMAYDGERLVGTVRLTSGTNVPRNAEVRGFYDFAAFTGYGDGQFSITSKLVVATDYRGSLVAAQLLAQAYDLGRDTGTVFNFMHCAPGLVPIYEMMGFRRYLRGRIDPDVGYRIPMVLVADDVAHMQASGSPFAARSGKFDNDPRNGNWFSSTFGALTSTSSARSLPSEEILSRLRRSSVTPILMPDLSEAEIKLIFRHGVFHSFHAGDSLIRSRDRVADIFFVLQGSLKMTHSGSGLTSMIQPGGCVGESCLLDDGRFEADVVAHTEGSMVSLSADAVRNLTLKNVTLAERFRSAIAGMLARTAEQGAQEDPSCMATPA